MRIIFFGSDDFAATNLEALIKSSHQIVACVTPPDKPKGRHLKVGYSPVKECALQNDIDILQPVDFKEGSFVEKLKDYHADLFVVIAYGRILPRIILSIPKIFCINVHGSLLPKYRGAAPINWAIINGDQLTGVSIIKMNHKMDAGEIIVQTKLKIDQGDTALTLREKMAPLSADLLLSSVSAIENNDYVLTMQNEDNVSFAPILTKNHGLISWKKSAVEIHNLIRGLCPWPGAFTHFQGKILKILETQVLNIDSSSTFPGEVINITPPGVVISTPQNALLVKRVHLESSKPMDSKDFAIGHRLAVGFKFE